MGGVGRLPRLLTLPEPVALLELELREPKGGNLGLAWDKGGGGSSKLGSVEAAERREAKLEDPESGSVPECIWDGWATTAASLTVFTGVQRVKEETSHARMWRWDALGWEAETRRHATFWLPGDESSACKTG